MKMIGGGGFGVGMLLFWVVLIVLVVILARGFFQTGGGGFFQTGAGGETRPKKSAREILDERYARGEIDREEYDEKKRMLS
jgi:putative membrane protein